MNGDHLEKQKPASFLKNSDKKHFLNNILYRAVVLKVVDIDPRGQLHHPRGR